MLSIVPLCRRLPQVPLRSYYFAHPRAASFAPMARSGKALSNADDFRFPRTWQFSFVVVLMSQPRHMSNQFAGTLSFFISKATPNIPKATSTEYFPVKSVDNSNPPWLSCSKRVFRTAPTGPLNARLQRATGHSVISAGVLNLEFGPWGMMLADTALFPDRLRLR